MIRRRAVPLALFALLLAAPVAAQAAPLAGPVETSRHAWTSPLTITDNDPDWPSNQALSEGGISGLEAIPGTGDREFWAVSDRGPNGQINDGTDKRTFLVPDYTPKIYRLRLEAGGGFTILQRLPLKLGGSATNPIRSITGGAAGEVTGLQNVLQTDGNTPFDEKSWFWDGQSDFFPVLADPYGVDTEGIARNETSGDFWIADEYRASVLRVNGEGTVLSRIVPRAPEGVGTEGAAQMESADAAPQDGTNEPLSFWNDGASGKPALNSVLPPEYNQRRNNRGLEGVALSADGNTLYTMLQSSLDVDDDDPDQDFGFYDNCGRNVDDYVVLRIARLNVTDPAAPTLTGEWVYLKDAPAGGTDADDIRVSDIAWVGADRLLVDERDDSTTGTQKKIYEVDLNASGATNIGAFSEAGRVCIDEEASAAALQARNPSVTPVSKSLYLDLAPLGYNFDKAEGIAPLEGGGVAVANDNDFGFTQAAASPFDVSPSNVPSQIRVYRSRSLSYPDVTVAAGSAVEVKPTAVVTGSSPTYSLSGCPSYLSVDAGGTVKGTAPSTAQAAQTCTVTVADANPGTASDAFSITVTGPGGGGTTPPPGGGTPPGGTPPRTERCVPRVTRASKRVRSGRLSITLRAPSGFTANCRGRVTLNIRLRGRTYRVGSVSYRVRSGRSITVRVRISRTNRRRLARRGARLQTRIAPQTVTLR